MCGDIMLLFFLRDNNSASMEPMDSDVYNNNLAHAKTGLKRRADDDQQDEISQVLSEARQLLALLFSIVLLSFTQ